MTGWRRVQTVGRVELRRRWRSLKGNPGQLIALAFAGLFSLLFVGILLFGAFAFGVSVRSGELERPIELVSRGLVYLWIFVAAFGGYRAYATALRPDRLDGLLTTVSHRELLGGLLFAEAIAWGVPSSVLVGLSAVLFAVGSGSSLAAPMVFATVGLVGATGLVTGWVVALAVRNAGVRSKLLTRLRTVLLAAVGLGYFWLIFTQAFDTVLAPVYAVLSPTPLGWFGDLFFAGTVREASLVRAGGAVVASALFVVASASALSRLAALLWYADGVFVEHERTAARDSTAETRLEAFVSRPIAGVVSRDWKRVRRAPITLSFVIYPVFVLIGPITTTIQTGTVSGSFPTLVALSGAWITGALFSLNVLGNEGAALPSTLLAANPGRRLVVGHAIAAGIVGIPLTVVATVGLGIASPHSLGSVLTLAVSAVVLSGVAVAIASGVGVVFPRFEEVRVSRSTKSTIPSLLAFVAYSIGLAVVALPTLLGHSAIVGHAITSWLDVSGTVVRIGGVALSTALGIGVGTPSVWYAMRSIDGFRFE
jgi:hypothetical protein